MDGERRSASNDKIKVTVFICTSEPARLVRHSHQSVCWTLFRNFDSSAFQALRTVNTIKTISKVHITKYLVGKNKIAGPTINATRKSNDKIAHFPLVDFGLKLSSFRFSLLLFWTISSITFLVDSGASICPPVPFVVGTISSPLLFSLFPFRVTCRHSSIIQ